MALGLLGSKVGMTHVFKDNGDIIPTTIIQVNPCIVSQIKTDVTDGYNAVQLGYLRKLPNDDIDFVNELNTVKFNSRCEFKVDDPTSFSLGQKVNVEIFEVGQKVQVSGKSIGKGFAGNQKRHNFARGPMTHGSKNHRAPGSIGAGTSPGRVLVGKKMAGQLGNHQTSISNLEIVAIDSDLNYLVVKGSIPGKPGNLVRVC